MVVSARDECPADPEYGHKWRVPPDNSTEVVQCRDCGSLDVNRDGAAYDLRNKIDIAVQKFKDAVGNINVPEFYIISKADYDRNWQNASRLISLEARLEAAEAISSVGKYDVFWSNVTPELLKLFPEYANSTGDIPRGKVPFLEFVVSELKQQIKDMNGERII